MEQDGRAEGWQEKDAGLLVPPDEEQVEAEAAETTREIPERFQAYADWVDSRAREPDPEHPYDLQELLSDLSPPDEVSGELPFPPRLVQDLDENDIDWIAEVFDLEGKARYGECCGHYHALNLGFIIDDQVELGSKLGSDLESASSMHAVPIAPLLIVLAVAYNTVRSGPIAVWLRAKLKDELNLLDQPIPVVKGGLQRKNKLLNAAGIMRDFFSDALLVGFGARASIDASVYQRLQEEFPQEVLNQVFELLCRFECVFEEEISSDRSKLEAAVESMNIQAPRMIPKTNRQGVRPEIVFHAFRGIGFLLKKHDVPKPWPKTERLFTKWKMSLKNSRVRQWEAQNSKNRSKL
jgi:hypothetical protein